MHRLFVAIQVSRLSVLIDLKKEDVILEVLEVIGDSEHYLLGECGGVIGESGGLIEVSKLKVLALFQNDWVDDLNHLKSLDLG